MDFATSIMRAMGTKSQSEVAARNLRYYIKECQREGIEVDDLIVEEIKESGSWTGY